MPRLALTDLISFPRFISPLSSPYSDGCSNVVRLGRWCSHSLDALVPSVSRLRSARRVSNSLGVNPTKERLEVAWSDEDEEVSDTSYGHATLG